MGTIGSTKQSDTATFTGYATPGAPLEQTSGTQQVSGFRSQGDYFIPISVLQAVPASSRVTVSCSDPRFSTVGPRQYTLRLILGESATLVGGLTDALKQASVVTPVTPFIYGSRQRFVATIDASTGVITTTGIGSTTLTVRYPVGAVNRDMPGGAANPSNFIEATVEIQVVRPQ